MFFSSLRVEKPIRFAGQAKRSAGCRRARQTRDARHAGEKKPAGWTTRQAFLPEGWTSRRTRAWRLYTNHSTESKHSTALAASAAKGSSRSGLMFKSPAKQAENKKPGGLRPTGSCETQEAEPPGVKGSKKAIRRQKSAAKPPQPCGSSMRLAWSGTASWVSRTAGCWPQYDG